MTYSTGSVILASDYNTFAGNVNTVLNSTYGQTALSTVSTGATVTAAQWASLNQSVANLAAHQGTIITSRSNPTAGQPISVLSNLGTDITSINTYKYNAYAQGTQYTSWTGTASKTAATGSGSAAWTITFTDTITFANTTAATNFFNAGGTIKVQFGKSSTGTSADPEWNNFVNTVCGTIYLSGTGSSKTINGVSYTGVTKIGGTGTPTTLATSTGYFNLTGTPALLYKQFDSGTAYSSNYLQITGAVSGAVLTLTTTWYSNGDPYGADISGGTATSGISFGTAPTTVVTYTPPESFYISNTWGTPTVVSSVS